MNRAWAALVLAGAMVPGAVQRAGAQAAGDPTAGAQFHSVAVSENAEFAVRSRAPETVVHAGVRLPVHPVIAPPPAIEDSCTSPEVVSNPSRPEWSSGAATTQCGVMENDFGWLWQPMGAGVVQRMWPLSVRYGLTPRMDLRWGLPTRVMQSGRGTKPLGGITDQTLSVTWRFLEQGRKAPALALSYGFKIPTASAAKGFGTGFADHQLTLIASRDAGPVHFDFNAVGALAGTARGYDGAAQYGLAMTLPVTKPLSWILEADGGPQPGTPERFGQGLSGLSWAVRPWLVVDTACTQAWTAGAPRQQITAGVTYAHRPDFAPIGRHSRIARLLGR